MRHLGAWCLMAAGATAGDATDCGHLLAGATSNIAGTPHTITALPFIQNVGQLDARVRFVARQGAVTAYFVSEGFVLQLRSVGAEVAGVNLFLSFEGVSEEVTLTGAERASARVSSFTGRDPDGWHRGLPAFETIRYAGLYPAVDAVVRLVDGHVEYDLLLASGADVAGIALRVEGARRLDLDGEGTLVIDTAVGELRQDPPLTWELGENGERRELTCYYRLLDDQHFGFTVPDWDQQSALVIDPGLIYSTYLGGSGEDFGGAIALGDDGAVYLAGAADALDFPTTPGAFDETWNGSCDAYVAKLIPSGSGAADLVYATFLGGVLGDEGLGIDVDTNGAVYVAGSTASADFPTTSGAFDTTSNGGNDLFFAKLLPDASGAADLVYSTFVGGAGEDELGAFLLTSSGAVLLGGVTDSPDFPVTSGAYDGIFNGGATDAFVVKLDPASGGTSDLLYGTYFGGALMDGDSVRLTVDDAGMVLLNGGTASSDFPTTPGAYQTVHGGGLADAYVARLDLAGGGPADLLYSTYLGGTGDDDGAGIAADGDDVYVIGKTTSGDFPTTPGAFDMTFNGPAGVSDTTLVRMQLAGGGSSDLLYSTYLGGSEADHVLGLALFSGVLEPGVTRPVLLAGDTCSVDFPTTAGAVSSTLNGTTDLFLTRLDPAGNGSADLVYSTFLGGSGLDYSDLGNTVVVDDSLIGYVTASTDSSDFPTTAGAHDETFNGTLDATLSLVDLCRGFFQSYGTGCVGSGGFVPTLTGSGCAEPGFSVSLTIANALGGGTTYFFVGLGTGSVKVKPGCYLQVLPLLLYSVFPLPGSGPGNGALTLTSSIAASTPSADVYLQMLVVDPGAPFKVAATPPLQFHVGP